MTTRHLVYSVRRFISGNLKAFAIRLLLLSYKKVVPRKISVLVKNIALTSTVRISNVRETIEFLEQSQAAYEADESGCYDEAVERRQQMFSSIVSNSHPQAIYYPPLIGPHWTRFIGHLCVLALHKRAQEMKYIPPGRRIIVGKQDEVANSALFDLVKESFLVIDNEELGGFEFLPALQPLFESYHSIRVSDSYEETHSFIQSVLQRHRTTGKPHSILNREMTLSNLSQEQIDFVNPLLTEPFVVFHLRQSGNQEKRDVSHSNYFEAFEFLTNSGFQVVNVSPVRIENSDRFRLMNVVNRDLHPFLFAHAQFAVTSTSGPSLFPVLFGTPNLVTNLTSIGRSMLDLGDNTFYLPKLVMRKGKVLNLSDLLDSTLAYDEMSMHQMRKLDVSLIENSRHEIQTAVEYMFTLLKKRNVLFGEHTLDESVRKIQSECRVVGRGRFVPTFLDQQPSFIS